MLTADALHRIAKGDRAAFTELYQRVQPQFVGYASALLAGDVDAALDVVDEAFLSIWREAGRYGGEGSADGWIRRIVRNKAVDWLRSRRERPQAPRGDHAVELADPSDTPERAAEKTSAAD
ncbi:MAG TPA: RNA polymerase sigma factor, partial [Phenylobacterium sp.]|nr:RNA polymerase sigma factor [Phenylobacterium sp.]